MYDKSGSILGSIGIGGGHHSVMAAMMGLALSQGVDPFPYQLRKPDNPYKTCLLHSCVNETNHNGGYCCAEHCKRHRVVTKILKQHKIKKVTGRFVFDWRL